MCAKERTQPISGRCLLDSKIEQSTVLWNNLIYISLRKAERKIPSSMLKAWCQQEELVWMRANGRSNVSSKQKKQIKEEVIEKNLMSIPPTLSSIPAVIDRANHMLYLGMSSSAQIDLFIEYFIKTFQDDDDFEKIFSKLFENLLGEDDGTPDRESEAGDLKKLYRELCLRYHPDRIGTHDAKTQRLWNEIQDAYMNHDLEGLRAIHSGIELESGKTELSCSEIDEMIFDLEWSIQDKRSELRAQKKTPIWGFASWTEQKRKQIAKEIKSEFDQNAQMTRLQLQHLEAELERLLQWKPKEKKRPIPQKKTNALLRNEKLADIPDLFNL